MPLREFVDSRGVRWRVWDVTKDRMHPALSVEEYLGDYREGWLSFESATERRRLPRVPVAWEALPDEEIEWLLDAAQVVGSRAPAATPPRPVERPSIEPARPDEGRLTPPDPREAISSARRRIFTDPQGRVVIACVERLPLPVTQPGAKVGSSPGSVLRFKTDHKLVFELSRWPDDWERLPKERLVELFLHAQREGERSAAQPEAQRGVRPSADSERDLRRRASDEAD